MESEEWGVRSGEWGVGSEEWRVGSGEQVNILYILPTICMTSCKHIYI